MASAIPPLSQLQANQENIRNICILAHVDHGKTTLSDSLLASNGIISSKLAGKVRYLDSREDEQERGITMKSSGISLYFKVIRALTDAPGEADKASADEYLVNLIDSPGHVDFSSEVSTASRLCDGGLVLVDAVEGVCTQTHTVLRQALVENVRPVLVLNKIDRLITEVKMTPLEAYTQLNQILGQVNAIVGTFHTENVMAEDARLYDARMQERKNKAEQRAASGDDAAAAEDADWVLDEKDDSDIYFAPERGNVIFSSAIDGWAFRPEQFASIYASKLGVREQALKRVLWGNFYFDPKTKRAIGPKGLKGRPLKPFFVQFILDNIWAVYDAVLNDREKVEKIVKTLNLKVQPRDLKSKDSKALLQTLMSQWLPLSTTVLLAVVDQLPSPSTAQHLRIPKILSPDPLLTISTSSVSTAATASLEKELIKCDANSSTVVAYISKVFSVPRNMLPHEKRAKLTPQQQQERRQQAIERARSLGARGTDDPTAAAGPAGMKMDEATALAAERAREEEDEAALAAEEEAEAEAETLIGFARIYSGTIRVGQRINVLGPKYEPGKPDAHRTEMVVKRLFLLMGREMQDLVEVPAGNVFGIAGIEGHVLKTATLSSTVDCPSFGGLKKEAPILRVAVEPENPSDMSKLVNGLHLLNQSDPCVEVFLQETGEHVIVTAGELHLERCIRDLKERYAKIEIHVSPPIVPFRECLSNNVATVAAAAEEAEQQEVAAAPVAEDIQEEELGELEVALLAAANRHRRRRGNRTTAAAGLGADKKGNDDSGSEWEGEGEDTAPAPAVEQLPTGTAVLTTRNGLATVRVRAAPLPKNVTVFLETSAARLRGLQDVLDSKKINSGKVDAVAAGKERRNVADRQKFVAELEEKFEEAAKEGWLVEKELWHGVIKRWVEGAVSKLRPKTEVELLAQTERDEVTSESGSRDESDRFSAISGPAPAVELDADGHPVGKRVRSIKDYENSILTGFQLATFVGPLCGEPMSGVAFFLESVKLDLENAESKQISLLTGQLITTVRDASEVLGKVYAVLNRRRGRILSEEMKEGTPFFNIRALLPVVESFGFSDDMRKKTAGAASPQLIFNGFDVLDLDPFWVPNTQEELEDLGEKADRENLARKYMNAVRKRKGMFVEKKIVEHAEKERNLKRK
ncbi:Cytoplasmic GTPase/eEF2-like protein (ribosomal biogenesis) [Irineochytrium annulatum]|nr:Cytoplasmic GTPase/eEF2-like protein (ribosomal biogenesis) [Irineochytrium annulatum]